MLGVGVVLLLLLLGERGGLQKGRVDLHAAVVVRGVGGCG